MDVTVHIFNVFVNEQGNFGNPVGIILDETQQLSSEQRLALTKKLGFSESVFINNLDKASISIYSSQGEIPFAGHAAVGTAYAISQFGGKHISELRGLKGSIPVTFEDNLVWVSSDLSITPPWWHEYIPTEKELLEISAKNQKYYAHSQVWTWQDQQKAQIRARTFAPAWDIIEDQANGSGCMRLAATLGLKIEVLHGEGSIIHAEPKSPGTAKVGGRVTYVEDTVLSL
ncbi:MAG: PhzF family phenazine biosynthesis protein [Alphaproteobacteria bacterium]|nr:PhzF family phenazine biosynthesis protein [Alphaproteobacteria bacterium]MDD9920169.1 PhzF family phenazine biosynthesis protein [Alphaproteobacteria bacterium]